MVDHLNVSYLYKKCGVYYFSKRVPNDLKSHYKTNRIVICLRTKSNISAIRSKKSILQKLDDYWTSVRITQMKIPAIHLIYIMIEKLNHLICHYLVKHWILI